MSIVPRCVANEFDAANFQVEQAVQCIPSKSSYSTRWQREGQEEVLQFRGLTIGWSWYHIPNGLESFALDTFVAVESQPKVSRLRRDLRGEIRATEVAQKIGVAVLAVTYLEEIVTTVVALFELEFISEIKLQ